VPEQLVQFFNDVKETLGRLLGFLSPRQKRLLFIGLPLILSVAYAAHRIYDRINYAPLFSNLSAQDGAAVVKELDAAKIPYVIAGGGTAIEVPSGLVHSTRLKLAGKGVPAGGGIGFEIFEKTPFGVSEFTQQVNYLRALQGELSRTINSLSAVQSSRIHLALPSRSNFLGQEEKPSASVVVDLRPGYHLSPDQVQGIVHLVASSVPKLSADKVTVIDSSGRPLKEIVPVAANSEAEKLNQLKLKHEQELERRIETMLDPVLGAGKVVVRASVQINPQETQMTKEQFDPQNRVVRSQRQAVDDTGLKGGGVPGVQSNIPGGDGGRTASETGSKRSSEMVTYEVGRTTSRILEPRGQVQKLSVAVLVDGTYQQNSYIPRTKDEIEVIKGMVKRAVGFDADRGDEIEVANVPFKIQPSLPAQPVAAPGLKHIIQTPLGIGIAAGAALVLGALIFLFMKRRSKEPRPESEQAAEAPVTRATNAQVQEEVAVVAQKVVMVEDPRKEQLTQIARDYHDATARIIRMWLQEDANKSRAQAAANGR
jgi:flagellar M-ring protein FliF